MGVATCSLGQETEKKSKINCGVNNNNGGMGTAVYSRVVVSIRRHAVAVGGSHDAEVRD